MFARVGMSEGVGDRSSIVRSLSSLWKSSEEKEENWGLGKKERIIGFFTCLFLGALCFALALVLSPLIVVKSRKFAALFTMGSLFSLGSFSFLWGPWEHLKHLLSLQRLPFTLIYLGTALGTLLCAIKLHSTILTLVFAVAQILALVWFLVSYIPGGTTGLTFMAKLFSRLCSRTISSAIDA